MRSLKDRLAALRARAARRPPLPRLRGRPRAALAWARRRAPRLRRLPVTPVALALIGVTGVAVAIADLARDEKPEPPRRIPSASERPAVGSGSGQSFLARLIPPAQERVRGPRVPRSISDLAERLPLEREVAQLFLFGFEGTDGTDPVFGQLRRLDLGGLVLEERNYLDPLQLAEVAAEARLVSEEERHVPPWVLAEQEGGDYSVFPDLPPAKAPGELRSPSEAADSASEAAKALLGVGLNGVLAPVVDVDTEEETLERRAYSNDPDKVAAFAAATVRAYARAGVLSAVRHFPGLGAASLPSEEGPPHVGLTLEQLEERDLIPFRAAIAAGAPAVVVGHGLYPTDDFVTPASLSAGIVTGLLRREIGYRGLVITDDLAESAITSLSTVPDAAIAAIRAGADMVYVSGGPGDQQAAYLAVLNAVRGGKIPRARIDEALYRVLTTKQRIGLIEK